MRLYWQAGLLVTMLTASIAAGLAQAPPPPDPRDLALFAAVNEGDITRLRQELKQGRDPNAPNFLMMTPLAFAAMMGKPDLMRPLLQAGSDPQAAGPLGSPLTLAAMNGGPEAIRLLLEKKVDVNAARPDRITPLMMAARRGDLPSMHLLLAHKAKVNALDLSGMTPLMHAAREGHTEAVSVLMRKGADIHAADGQGWTPLAHASMNGHGPAVELLLRHGAKANHKDAQGRTPLLLAASFGDHPATVRILLRSGARVDATDQQRRSVLTLAEQRGYHGAAKALRAHGAPELGVVRRRTAEEALKTGLSAIQTSHRGFITRTGCVSCHHEGLGLYTLGVARSYGVSIDEKLREQQVQRVRQTLGMMKPTFEQQALPGHEVGEGVPSVGFLLWGLIGQSLSDDDVARMGSASLWKAQRPTGEWTFSIYRAPVQSSRFTVTALALQVAREFGPKEGDAEGRHGLERARNWLTETRAVDNEDRTFRLLGLRWAEANSAALRVAAEDLLRAQRSDGGWAQADGMKSDAYATGQALYALHTTGALPATAPEYRRGIDFLLRTQDDPGSWYVAKRAIPGNNYFDTGLPYGQSQYISHAATCWAVLALLPVSRPAAPVATR